MTKLARFEIFTPDKLSVFNQCEDDALWSLFDYVVI
jgi:hypothetical protein